MISNAVVTHFAHALADVVLGQNGMDPQTATADLRAFDNLFREFAVLSTVLASPAVSPVRKRNVVKKLAETLGVSPTIRNFVLVLTDHRRVAALSRVIEAFELALDERMGFVRAEVKSAVELSDGQKQELAGQLAALAGKQVRMRFAVDSELIGGATAQLGSTVYDGSVRGQLETLRSRIAF